MFDLDFGPDCIDTAQPTLIERQQKSDRPQRHPPNGGARFASIDRVLDDLMKDDRFKALKSEREHVHC